MLMVIVWLPSYFFIKNADTWQLIINTCTTIVTFLMVAILENSQRQFENTTNAKLDGTLKGVAELLDSVDDPIANELKRLIGSESEIGAKK